MEVLTPDSQRWEEFCEELDAAIAEYGCAAGTNKDNAKAVMRKMGSIDVEGSLAYFEDHGGYCDCEILMNVHAPLTDEERGAFKQMDRQADETSNEEIIVLARRVAGIVEKDQPDEIMQLSMEYGQAMTVAMTIAPLMMGRKGMIGTTHPLADRVRQIAELLGVRHRVETKYHENGEAFALLCLYPNQAAAALR